MATLADTLAAKSHAPGVSCALGRWLDTQTVTMQEDVIGALRDRRVSGQALADWLTGQGVKSSSNALNRHRRGACAWCVRRGFDMGFSS